MVLGNVRSKCIAYMGGDMLLEFFKYDPTVERRDIDLPDYIKSSKPKRSNAKKTPPKEPDPDKPGCPADSDSEDEGDEAPEFLHKQYNDGVNFTLSSEQELQMVYPLLPID